MYCLSGSLTPGSPLKKGPSGAKKSTQSVAPNVWGWVDPYGLVDLNLFDPSSTIYKKAEKVPIDKDVFKVGAHGSSQRIIDAQKKTVSPKKLAQMIGSNDKYRNGMKIELLSCHTGNGPNSYAQQLADVMNTKVTAPDTLLWYNSDGGVRPAPRDPNDPSKPDLNNLGKMVEFNPQKKCGN
jgi:hypothetical protein